MKWALSFPRLNGPIDVCVRFYRDRMRARSSTIESNAWDMLERSLRSAHTSYRGACLLVSDDRDEPLPIQAAMVARSAIEAAGNVLYMLEDPVRRTRDFWIDHYAHERSNLKRIVESKRFSKSPKWKVWIDNERKRLVKQARVLGLSDHEASNPELLPLWPTPGRMLRGGVKGTRRGVLRELRDTWYRKQSSFAHQLGDALLHTRIPDWLLPDLKTDAVLPSTLALACILTEIEEFGGQRWASPRPKELVDLWGIVAKAHDAALEVYRRRYTTLLGVHPTKLLERADVLLGTASRVASPLTSHSG